jgi:hypothetical protein
LLRRAQGRNANYGAEALCRVDGVSAQSKSALSKSALPKEALPKEASEMDGQD